MRVAVTAPASIAGRFEYCRVSCTPWCENPQTCEAVRRRNSIVEKYFYVVPRVASAMMRTLPHFIQLPDLISYGSIGLMRAAESYSAERANTFEAYVAVVVRGAIVDELRSQDWAPRSLRRRQRQYTHAVSQAEGELGRDPALTEVAGVLGISTDEVRRTEIEIAISYPVTLESAEGEGASADLYDEVASTFLQEIALTTIRAMPILHRTVVTYHYYLGHTLATTAALVGVSPARVGSVHSEVVEAVLDAVMRAATLDCSA